MHGQKQKCLNKTEMREQQQIYLDKNINDWTKQKCLDKTNTWKNAWPKTYIVGQNRTEMPGQKHKCLDKTEMSGQNRYLEKCLAKNIYTWTKTEQKCLDKNINT
jgi:hypothetical protein